MAKKLSPRKTPNRDEKYMGAAFIEASFSKDPSTQNGAVIVTTSNKPLGRGYNGPPPQYNDNDMDWSRPAKYANIIHAEKNAIKHSNPDKLPGSTIYITGRPCAGCMLAIVDAGISRVVYFDGKYHDSGSIHQDQKNIEEADEIIRNGRIKVEQFKGNLNWLRDRIKQLEELGIFD